MTAATDAQIASPQMLMSAVSINSPHEYFHGLSIVGSGQAAVQSGASKVVSHQQPPDLSQG